MITLRAAYAAEVSSLAKFRAFIDANCAQAGIGDATCQDIKLAVDEACTNIIEHGYADIDPGSIIIEFYADKHRAVITLTDFGHAFEPYEPEAPDVQSILESDHVGGFGLYFIYQTMDEVDYQSNEDGNSLVLTKKLV
jgi:anti-sigma regulatory factor (Ser/Thr protein kinase)